MFPQHEIFDDWFSAGFEADDMWRDYEKGKGHDFQAALQGHAAKHVFQFDKHHLDTCDVAVLVLPAGKSGHLELGYVAGKGKPTAILLDSDPDRFDVMYQFADRVATNESELVEWLNSLVGIPLFDITLTGPTRYKPIRWYADPTFQGGKLSG